MQELILQDPRLGNADLPQVTPVKPLDSSKKTATATVDFGALFT